VVALANATQTAGDNLTINATASGSLSAKASTVDGGTTLNSIWASPTGNLLSSFDPAAASPHLIGAHGLREGQTLQLQGAAALGLDPVEDLHGAGDVLAARGHGKAAEVGEPVVEGDDLEGILRRQCVEHRDQRALRGLEPRAIHRAGAIDDEHHCGDRGLELKGARIAAGIDPCVDACVHPRVGATGIWATGVDACVNRRVRLLVGIADELGSAARGEDDCDDEGQRAHAVTPTSVRTELRDKVRSALEESTDSLVQRGPAL
jgi:hypothetical protein